MPLTRTINTLPKNDFDLTLGAEFVRGDYLYRRDSAELGLGLTDDLSLWYGISYNHRVSGPGGNEIGDSFLRAWYFIGSFQGTGSMSELQARSGFQWDRVCMITRNGRTYRSASEN